jgi:hypothetical protein
MFICQNISHVISEGAVVVIPQYQSVEPFEEFKSKRKRKESRKRRMKELERVRSKREVEVEKWICVGEEFRRA